MMFDVKDRIAVITGGYGVLGSSMARCLAVREPRLLFWEGRQKKEKN